MTKKIILPLICFLAIAGCQSNNVSELSSSELNQYLEEIAVAFPPRDPFKNFSTVPQTLDDLDTSNFCDIEAAPDIDEWLEKEIDRWRYYKGKTVYAIREYANDQYRIGRPEHAAALLEATNDWSPPTWTTDRVKSRAFLAKFYAAFGDINRARTHYKLALLDRNTSSKSCRETRAFWINSAGAHVALAEGEPERGLSFTAKAMESLAQLARAKDGECGTTIVARYVHELKALEAEALFQLGKLSQAESQALEKLTNYSTATTFGIKKLHLLSKIKMHQGRYQDATSFGLMAKQQIQNACYASSSPERARINKDLALSFLALNDIELALRLFKEIELDLEPTPVIWKNLFENSIDRGIILHKSGDYLNARLVYQNAAEQLAQRFGTESQQASEARILDNIVNEDVSIQTLELEIRQLLDFWQNNLNQDRAFYASPSIRIRWIVESYLSRLFDKPRSPEQFTRAFELSEMAKSGTVQQALQQLVLRNLAPSTELRDLVRENQILSRKLEILRHQLFEEQDLARVSSETITDLENKIEEIEQLIQSQNEVLAREIPEFRELSRTEPFRLEEIVGVLASNEVLISTSIGYQQSFIWVVNSRGELKSHRIFKTAQDWRNEIEKIRSSIIPHGNHLGDFERFDIKTAYQIYADLLRPYERDLSIANHLIFAVDDSLANLPMSVLLSRPETTIGTSTTPFESYADLAWLIKTHAISTVPSASSLAYLRKVPSENIRNREFLGIGDPLFNPAQKTNTARVVRNSQNNLQMRNIGTTRALKNASLLDLPPLPDTAEEIKSIASVLGANPSRDIYLGARASESNLRLLDQLGELGNYKVISFATHGLVPGDLDGLQSPAIALSRPAAKPKGAWDDGLLTTEEIMELDINADWIILSACNTAAPQASSNEAFSGLGQAFIYSGAKSLLLSNWPVVSDSTEKLMVSIFSQNDSSISRAEALRRASLGLMTNGYHGSGGARYSYAHPLFWAPFTLVGNGGN